ncbi:hypothetical protein [Streptomyces sp. NPDC015131]|uniref:hypothetical protein n=1 Tax=Streptomyces sp. NPDC015131 TaxID=3364941 RepID=UPI0036FD46EB
MKGIGDWICDHCGHVSATLGAHVSHKDTHTCPGRETVPNPCRCPCYGCRHHCGAHNPDNVEDE